jgi:tRNA(Met) C34 N-acetyltransferase TmcA
VVLAGLSASGRRFVETALRGFPERLRRASNSSPRDLEPEILSALLADGSTGADARRETL